MSSVKTKNLTPLYAFIQGLYWMNFAAIMGYSGFYLLGSGFSNTEIGIIIAIAGILSAVLQPVLASYADRPDSPSLKKFLQLLLVLQLILGISLSFLQINIADRSCLWLRCDPASASDPVYQFSWNGKYQSGT